MQRTGLFIFASFLLIFAFGTSADTLGQSQKFFISPQYDAQSRAVVTATLRHISDRAYFYVADDYWDSVGVTAHSPALDQIKLLAQEFDGLIYPKETEFFGSEPNPGIDGDPRITILLTPLIENAGGYFDTTNQYPLNRAINSNQREIIYLNISKLANQNKIRAFLAHEFQHLISFNQKETLRNMSDDVWLNELRSEYAVTLLSYNDAYEGSHLQERARALSENPSDSLTEWKNFSADYGQIGLFGEYLAGHWSPQVIADTLKNNLAGISSINESLAKNNFGETFMDIYQKWLIASFLNDAAIDSKFSYKRNELRDLRIVPAKVLTALGDNGVLTISDSIKDWQGRWYEISQFTPGNKNVLKVTFSSPSLASFNVVYIVFKTDGSKQFFTFNPAHNSDTFYVYGTDSDLYRVVIIPIKKDKLSGFTANETTIQLTTIFERVSEVPSVTLTPNPILTSPDVYIPATPKESLSDPTGQASYKPSATNLPDGSLIRAEGDYKVYVIRGKWRRHIINSRIFGFYPGLGFEKVAEVKPEVLNNYQESNLIRYAGSQRVYEVDKTGRRRWLNLSAQKFAASGRSWDAVFTVNIKELQFYKIGASITK